MKRQRTKRPRVVFASGRFDCWHELIRAKQGSNSYFHYATCMEPNEKGERIHHPPLPDPAEDRRTLLAWLRDFGTFDSGLLRRIPQDIERGSYLASLGTCSLYASVDEAADEARYNAQIKANR